MARTRAFDELEILDKAVELFWERGYTATSANDLVETLGLSRSSLYATYGDKRNLFIRSLERYRRQFVQATLKIVKTSDDLPKTIAAIFKMIVEQDIKAKIPKGCFMVNTSIELAAHDQEIEEIVNESMKDIEQVFEKAIEIGQSKGQIATKHEPKALARFLYNTISGLRVAMRSKSEAALLDDVIKVALSVL